MKQLTKTCFFEIVYDKQHYQYLEMIRVDYICDILYITFKDFFTSEMYTFEKEKISFLQKVFL
ncbi:hypothetical protein MKX67_12605 [Cytobacillus sp. FSL W7-1323]|uniref:Uncharacterized protein n=1 Tax=Cytobacillus kochii TaxID=859143 RepID=A0A286R7V2_9BACI|nr:MULTISPECIES: hypothetical protein [Cytobacillus]ASV69571.1 hypothetical protein CKF48_21015 [Cytobacillus kochii]MDQ0184358.1 hypothetical protein [Cytobacillus kochii]MEA1852469.1 hypothetical protein [Cytobacillus sp. OWB-43]MED1604657.1 hypothetical protein [Cytobacillus kochii]